MDKLINIIEENIQKTVHNYILLISSNYNIDINELENLWNTPTHTPKQKPLPSSSTPTDSPKASPKASPKDSPKASPKDSSKASPKDSSKNKCVYKFTKGKQQGDICNGGIKGDSQYCSKHLKFEETGQKDKKVTLPVSVSEKKSVDRLVRLNKEINKWWHLESKLVFKSDKEKIVVGVYKDDTYRELCNDDIEECNKYGFRYELPEPVKIEKKTKPNKIVTSIAHEVNMHAKNIEDVISDMLDDSDDDNDSEKEEELEEEEDLDLEEEE